MVIDIRPFLLLRRLGTRTLLVTSASLLVTSALLVVTRTLLGAKGIATRNKDAMDPKPDPERNLCLTRYPTLKALLLRYATPVPNPPPT